MSIFHRSGLFVEVIGAKKIVRDMSGTSHLLKIHYILDTMRLQKLVNMTYIYI